MISGEMMKEIIRNSYLENENILIVGYGKSGVKSSELAKRLGATVFVYDDNKDVEVNKEVVDKIYNNIDDIDFSNINITVFRIRNSTKEYKKWSRNNWRNRIWF